jgi:hypothetical protein
MQCASRACRHGRIAGGCWRTHESVASPSMRRQRRGSAFPQPYAVLCVLCSCVCVVYAVCCVFYAACTLCAVRRLWPHAELHRGNPDGPADCRAIDRQLTAPPASIALAPRVPTASPRPMPLRCSSRCACASPSSTPRTTSHGPIGRHACAEGACVLPIQSRAEHGGTERRGLRTASLRRMYGVPCATCCVRCTTVSALPAGALV